MTRTYKRIKSFELEDTNSRRLYSFQITIDRQEPSLIEGRSTDYYTYNFRTNCLTILLPHRHFYDRYTNNPYRAQVCENIAKHLREICPESLNLRYDIANLLYQRMIKNRTTHYFFLRYEELKSG